MGKNAHHRRRKSLDSLARSGWALIGGTRRVRPGGAGEFDGVDGALLRTGGFALLDVQFVTAHLQLFGTAEIPRAQYRAMLEAALKLPAHFPAGALAGAAVAELLQSSTLTS